MRVRFSFGVNQKHFLLWRRARVRKEVNKDENVFLFSTPASQRRKSAFVPPPQAHRYRYHLFPQSLFLQLFSKFIFILHTVTAKAL